MPGQFVNFESWVDQGAPVYKVGDRLISDKWSDWALGPFEGVLIGSELEELTASSSIAGIRVLWEDERSLRLGAVESEFQFWSNRGALVRVKTKGITRAIEIASRIYGIVPRAQLTAWIIPTERYGSPPMVYRLTLDPGGFMNIDPAHGVNPPLMEPAPKFPYMGSDPEPEKTSEPLVSWPHEPLIKPEWLEGRDLKTGMNYRYSITVNEAGREEDPAPTLAEMCEPIESPHHDTFACTAYRASVTWREFTEDFSDRALDLMDRFSDWLRSSVDNRGDVE